MKRVVLVLTLALVVVGVIGGTASSEDGPSTFATPCGLLDGNGDVVIGLGVLTFYDSGKVTLDCSASGVANPSGTVINWNYEKTGLSCSLASAGSTTTWRNRIGRGGESQLHCETYLKGAILLRASSSSVGLG